MQWGGKRAFPEPKQGIRFLVGQHKVKQKDGSFLDKSERLNFERSKYIPGNGSEHRLGKRTH